jgi:hypothetical protein
MKGQEYPAEQQKIIEAYVTREALKKLNS